VLDEPSEFGDTEPVPEIGDSARFVRGFGVVEFIAAGRTCDVQVAVLGDGRNAAVAIAALVRERL